MNDFALDVENCLEVLRRGGVILYPTDTIWGLGCDGTNPQAVEKIYQLKERPPGKSMIILLGDERDLLNYVAAPAPELFDFLKTVSRPTTVVYDGVIGLADNLTSDDGTAAIRIVKDPFCLHLVKRLRKPLVSTSANLSGESTPRNFSEIPAVIRESVDYVVRYRQEDIMMGQPSDIVRLKKDGSLTLLRGSIEP